MERDIDKRQTVEEAAHLFAESRSSGSAFPAYYQGFIAGAEWQAKQFPWISTKDKLPDDEDLVITGCWCTDYFKYLQQGWYCRECNEWYDTNGDKICVTHWMPILDLRNSINRAFTGRLIIKKQRIMSKYTSKQIAESDDLFEKQIRKVRKFYLSRNPDKMMMLEERKAVIKERNKGLSPEYDKEYYCGTCGAKDGAEHPKTGYCFHCDTDNWIPKND